VKFTGRELAKLPRDGRLGAYEDDDFDYTVLEGTGLDGIPSSLGLTHWERNLNQGLVLRSVCALVAVWSGLYPYRTAGYTLFVQPAGLVMIGLQRK
jgi:hypothetical protein